MKRTLQTIILFAITVSCAPKAELTVLRKTSSPDGRLSMTISSTEGKLSYCVEYDGKTVVSPSELGLELDEGYFGDQVKIVKSRTRTVKDSYELPVGKCSHVDAVCKESRITLSDEITLDLVVRVYDDGAAFRYEIPDQETIQKLNLRAERMDMLLGPDSEATVLPLKDFHNSHEGNYLISNVKELPEDSLFDLPATFKAGDDIFLSFTEADVRDYAGMYLVKSEDALTSKLSPRLDQPEYCVISDLPHHSPWRVFSVSDRIGAIMESNILTNLAEPCRIGDTSWLKPGKTTFNWWCATQVPDSVHAGNNFETSRYYIDFAAEFGLEYHSVFGYGDEPWYVDSVMGFSECGPDADLTRTVPELDFPAVCSYAASKGVDIHVWTNWKALYQNIDANFDKFNEWGVKGMMVDFMDRDDQQMIQIQEEILKKAAEHHLFVQFHGSSKPSGLSRTYPNEFTREGTLNYEVYKWHSDRLGADHDITMPFTRVLAGPADYHLGGFRAMPAQSHVADYFEPKVTNTRCHMLAMYVVLESYLHMVADYPENYRGEPGAEFLSAVPTTWDETRVLDAKLNEYEVIGRRSGDDWYMGAISNHEGRSIGVKLDFLGNGEYELTWFMDGDNVAEDPNHLMKMVTTVTQNDTITLNIAPDGGGAALIFRKLSKS